MSERDVLEADPRWDAVSDVLRDLPAPGLDPAVAARVLTFAKAHLEPAVVSPVRVRFALAHALVPALLGTVVVDHIAETVTAVDVAYGKGTKDRTPRR